MAVEHCSVRSGGSVSVGVFHEHLLSWEECIVVTGEVGVTVEANCGARGLW